MRQVTQSRFNVLFIIHAKKAESFSIQTCILHVILILTRQIYNRTQVIQKLLYFRKRIVFKWLYCNYFFEKRFQKWKKKKSNNNKNAISRHYYLKDAHPSIYYNIEHIFYLSKNNLSLRMRKKKFYTTRNVIWFLFKYVGKNNEVKKIYINIWKGFEGRNIKYTSNI